MTTSKQTTQSQSSQQAQSQPYAPTIPVLNSILSGVQTQLPNYQANATEQGAFNQLNQNAAGLPNFAPQATNIANQFMTGDPSGLLKSSYNNFNTALNPIATGNLDPTQTPGIQNLLGTIRNDVGNNVNGLFAGAGRDLSGANTQALSRGLAQGEAQPLLSQYNQNVQNAIQAATGLYGAGNTTSAALGNNQAQGFNIANLVPGLQNASPLQILQAQAMARGLPIQNLAQNEALTVPIAGLGQQVSGSSSGTSTTRGTPSVLSDLTSIFGGGQNSTASGLAGAGLGILSFLGA